MITSCRPNMDHNAIRQRLEEKEELLSSYAVKSRLAIRDRSEEPSPVRTEFQRDRDRIIHSNSFRRLKHKTQVFIAPQSDHYVTRLTHTLEVSQVARTISRALNLNEDLAEAISLGHDLGHTPFGHVGEEVLNAIHPEGFRHNEQSLRVVEILEKEGRGLNLTREVREGILKHSKPRQGLFGEGWKTSDTFEGQVCQLADSIAYVNHDIGDAMRAGIITSDDLPVSTRKKLGISHSARINTLVIDVIRNSWAVTGSAKAGLALMISLSPEILEAMNSLREFLFSKVYDVRAMKWETERAKDAVSQLYRYFTRHIEEIPQEFIRLGDGVDRAVVDYIAGMTDQYALRLATEVK